MRMFLIHIVLGIILVPYFVACTNEQVKRGAYYSIHEQQRRQCIEQGRTDCSQYDYDSYEDYQRKKSEK